MQQQPNGAMSAGDINALFATDRDRGADTAAPAEQKHEQPKAEAPAQAPPAVAPPAQQSASEQDNSEARHVPLSELLAERKKRQETERLTQEMQGRLSAYEQQLAQLIQRQPAQPSQPQQPAPIPDPIVDPTGHAAWVQHQIDERVYVAQQQMRDQALHMMEANARRTYGDALVNEAFQVAQRSNGVMRQLTQYPDPWATLAQWYQQQQVVSRIGGDIGAYEERLRKEGADRALAGLKNGTGNGQPQQQPRFPTTLADHTAASAQGTAPQSGTAMINALFAPDRNRKAF